MYLHIFCPVKRIITHKLEITYHHIPGIHGEIVASGSHMFHLYTAAVP